MVRSAAAEAVAQRLDYLFCRGKPRDELGENMPYVPALRANLKVNDWYKLIPGNGVYAVKIVFEGVTYNGMLNIGTRPTISGNDVTIEVHLFNFNQDIYTKNLRIEFVEKIREEEKFNQLTDLQSQLIHDKEKALFLLS